MVGSPGRITFGEVMEVLFGYLVFAGLDRIFSLIGSMWTRGKDETRAEQVKVLLQLLGIVIAIIVLFRHKFFT